MESKPPLEAGPPVLIESVVRLLLPPPTREHVLGDLAERYSTPSRYVAEALRTVPFVIASQIRRTSQFSLAPIVAVTLLCGFSTSRNLPWIHAIAPAAAAMIGLLLRDAYKIRDPQRPWRQGAVDIGVAAAAAVASQLIVAIVRPDLLLQTSGAVGGTVALGMLYLLRIQNPGRTRQFVSESQTMTLAQLREEAEGYAIVMRRSARIEMAAALVLIPMFSSFTAMGRPSPARIGAAMTVMGGMLVLMRMWRVFKSMTPIAADADFATIAATHRARLERQQHALRTIWLWYLLPLSIGPFLMLGMAAQGATQRDAANAGVVIAFLVLCSAIVFPARSHARKMQTRIDALQRVEEQR